MSSDSKIVAKTGRSCPLCTYLRKEEAAKVGLNAGWYREDDGKSAELIPCDHTFDASLEDVLIMHSFRLRSELDETRRMLRLIRKAIKESKE